MYNKVNFTGRNSKYLVITKAGRQRKIPKIAYEQINENREQLEKFAKKNNVRIMFTDAKNMCSELEFGKENDFFNDKLVITVEKRSSLWKQLKTILLRELGKLLEKTPTCEIFSIPYYTKASKNIPSLKEKPRVGYLLNYVTSQSNKQKSVEFKDVVDFLQTVVGKKSIELSNIKY